MNPILGARRRDLETLAADRWDLLVVGGGITGSGILLDAASRGLRAALVEKEDYAVGTSGRSSRLIHGGLRYLEQFRVGLVREALAERRRLLRLAPHLVRIEPFLFPLYGGPLTRPFYDAGLTLYDLLGARSDGGWHHHLSVNEALEATPVLHRRRLRGAFVYHDGQEDDARYNLAVARTARARGALPLTKVSAVAGIERDGRIAGVTVRDELSGDTFDVAAERVVDATGVWSGRPGGPFPVTDAARPTVRPSRGSHLVVPRDRIPSAYGLTLRIPGRVCFLVPWPDRWVIGTTDLDDEGPPDRPVPTAAEIDNILGNVNATLDVDLTRADLVGAYTGLRPLATDPGGHPGSTVKASREHRIRTDPNGLVRIGGGKYTTYRLMAAQTVDVALGRELARQRPSQTAELPIIGAAPPAELRHARRSPGLGDRPRSGPSGAARRPARDRGRRGGRARARDGPAPAARAGRRPPRGRGRLGGPIRGRAVARRRPGPPDPAGPGAVRPRRRDRAAGRRAARRRARLVRGGPRGRDRGVPGVGPSRVRRARPGADLRGLTARARWRTR